jgi:hypothetical protein
MRSDQKRKAEPGAEPGPGDLLNQDMRGRSRAGKLAWFRPRVNADDAHRRSRAVRHGCQ